MRFLLSLLSIALLFISASANAWWHNQADQGNRNNHWREHYYSGTHDGSHDGMGGISADASLQGNIQFNMRSNADAEVYVFGHLGNGWDNVSIEHYSNDAIGPGYHRYYEKGGQPGNRRWFYYDSNRSPFYRPYYGHGEAMQVPAR